jgi:hypothetical protein
MIAERISFSVHIYTCIHILFCAEFILSMISFFLSFDGKIIIFQPEWERNHVDHEEIMERFPL